MTKRRNICLISRKEAGQSILIWLSSRFSYCTRDQWKDFICEGRIFSNGRVATCEIILEENDTIEFIPPEVKEPHADLTFRIIHESPDFAVISKPAHLPVHPSGRYFNNTLWSLLKDRWSWFHFCTRLDRETSGLILIALKKEFLHHWLKISDQSRRDSPVIKEYSALCFGVFNREIDARGFLFPNPEAEVRKKLKYVPDHPGGPKIPLPKAAQWCRTIIMPVETFSEQTPAPNRMITHVRCRLFTGRTHQIRATLLGLGFPVVGDKLYGPDETIFLRFAEAKMTEMDRQLLILDRQALHCERLEFKWKNERQVFFDKHDFSIKKIAEKETL